MTLLIPSGYAEHIVQWSNAENTHLNSVAYGVELTDGSDLTAICTDLNSAWKTELGAGALCDAYVMTQGELRTEVASIVLPINEAGTASSSPAPNVAVLWKKVCAERGRANRGRFYLPAGYVGEGVVDNGGNLPDSEVVVQQSNADALYTAITAVAGVDNMVVLHSSALAPTAILNLQAESMVATQRRRLR